MHHQQRCQNIPALNVLKRALMGLCFICLLLSAVTGYAQSSRPAESQSTAPIRIALMLPHDTPFWNRIASMSNQAARDLGVELSLYPYQLSAARMEEQARAAIAAGVDGLIIQTWDRGELAVLALAEEHQIPSILINNGIPNKDFKPRKQFKYWLGSMTADDFSIGERLINGLVQHTEMKRQVTQHHILAIGGDLVSDSSIIRVNGMKSFVARHEDKIASLQIEHADWGAEKAGEIFEAAWAENPQITEVWCASDRMAKGVADKIAEMGIDNPPAVGGVDWETDTAEYLRTGKMTVSIGGHFLDGAWAVIMLYDYLNGVDFANQGLEFESLTISATSSELQRYMPFFELSPTGIEFSNLSMFNNPRLLTYDFNLRETLSQNVVEQPLSLSDEEQAWLRDHRRLKIGTEANRPPFSFINSKNKPDGFAVELMKYIANRADIKLEFVKSNSRDSLLNSLDNGQVDLLSSVEKQVADLHGLAHSQSFLTLTEYFFSRPNTPPLYSLRDLKNRKIVLITDSSFSKWFQESYPTAPYVEKNSLYEGLVAVSNGEADIVVSNYAAVAWLIEKYAFTNIKVNGLFTERPDPELHIAVSKDARPLISIINKAIDEMPLSIKSTLIYKWLRANTSDQFSGNNILLSQDERIWLDQHPAILMSDEFNRRPFSFINENGDFDGISANFIEEFSRKLGLEFKVLPGSASAQQTRDGEQADVIAMVSTSSGLSSDLLLTEPYVSFPVVIVAPQKASGVSNLWELSGKEIGIIQGPLLAKLEREHAELTVRSFTSIRDAFIALNSDEIDAVVSDLATVSDEIEQSQWLEVKITGATGYSEEIAMGVRKDWPELVSILNKTINSMESREKNAIKNKWLRINVNLGTDLITVFLWAVPIAMVIFSIIFYILLSNRRLSQAKAQITMHTTELERTNNSLQQTLDELKLSQKKMIEQEKMASLGSLVAGVSHEINTPLGISVTAVSHEERLIEELAERFSDNRLTKSFLDRFIDEAREGSQATSINLSRAANLVQSFKNISMDQNQDTIRQLNLSSYLKEILVSLNPQIKKSGHEIKVNCPESIFVTTKPGAIAQILTNLIMNSLIHAFPDDSRGVLQINVTQSRNMIEMHYSDNGAGMNEEPLKRIFEPFFTTRLGFGGSGLGAHIIYNLVTNVLQGNIEVESTLGEGTKFIIHFPIEIDETE